VGDEGDLGNEGDEGLRVSAGALGADVTLEGEPRRGAIEQARVAEAIAELERRCRADARLAGRAGAVEGDDESGRVAGHAIEDTGWTDRSGTVGRNRDLGRQPNRPDPLSSGR